MSRRGCCSLSAASKCAVPAELKLSLCCEVWQEVLINAGTLIESSNLHSVPAADVQVLCQDS